jgi:hypothetical protein
LPYSIEFDYLAKIGNITNECRNAEMQECRNAEEGITTKSQ